VAADEAGKACRRVMIGEADTVWQTIVSDAKAGRLRKRYSPSAAFDLAGLRLPQGSAEEERYFFTNTVQIRADVRLTATSAP